MTNIRIVDRVAAVSEIAQAIQHRQHWVIGAGTENVGNASEKLQESWEAAAYLDNGTPIILVGTSDTALATAEVMSLLGTGVSAVFVIPKAATLLPGSSRRPPRWRFFSAPLAPESVS